MEHNFSYVVDVVIHVEIEFQIGKNVHGPSRALLESEIQFPLGQLQ